jgi:hypothetical protein
MSLATFKIGREEYVVISRKRYQQLTQAEQDQLDADVAKKGREAYSSGKMKTITHGELKRKLGL